ncbi:hypothetical protein SKAU_G00044170 [Synaphobranchus kaupii]|uniref:F-BAR domain-containing protein n=1 Tax=Synaphobranchus kaupii TaxID=118154 RepID=A0A9Q1G1R3_SYNKA|nr:hypothetical protein SKAU_G00044170 [Synaphobranchus kaupii]
MSEGPTGSAERGCMPEDHGLSVIRPNEGTPSPGSPVPTEIRPAGEIRAGGVERNGLPAGVAVRSEARRGGRGRTVRLRLGFEGGVVTATRQQAAAESRGLWAEALGRAPRVAEWLCCRSAELSSVPVLVLFLCAEIRAQLVEQQKCLEQQTEMRVQLLQDLQDFFRKKSEIEMEYSRNLEKLAERFMAKTRSTKDHQQYKKDQNLLSPVNCWYLLLNQVRRESKDHATLSDIYLNNVIMRFMQISEDSTRLLKKSKEITFQLQEDLMKVLNELYTVMKTYHMYHTESLSAECKLKEAEKQEEKQIGRSADPVFHVRAEDKHQRRSSVKKIEKMKEKYYIHDLSDLIDCCDLGYHASLNRSLRTYLSAEYNLETSRHEGLDIMENAVDSLDPRSDRQRFMEMYPTAFCPPVKFEYQSHMGDEVSGDFIPNLALPVCQITAQPPVQAELMLRFQQLQSRLATLKIENEEVKKTSEATLTTLQDMVTIEDYDVSECFHHSRSTESVKSAVSETYLSKPSMAKRRANQQETEQFYFMKFREYLEGSNLISKLQAKHDLLKRTLGDGHRPEYMTTRNSPRGEGAAIRIRPRLFKIQRMNRHRQIRENVLSSDPFHPYIPLLEDSVIFAAAADDGTRTSGTRIPDRPSPVWWKAVSDSSISTAFSTRVFSEYRGSQLEVNDIKNSFERGNDPLTDEENNHDINSVAGVLKLYFRVFIVERLRSRCLLQPCEPPSQPGLTEWEWTLSGRPLAALGAPHRGTSSPSERVPYDHPPV